jgi:hypothetical protein
MYVTFDVKEMIVSCLLNYDTAETAILKVTQSKQGTSTFKINIGTLEQDRILRRINPNPYRLYILFVRPLNIFSYYASGWSLII